MRTAKLVVIVLAAIVGIVFVASGIVWYNYNHVSAEHLKHWKLTKQAYRRKAIMV